MFSIRWPFMLGGLLLLTSLDAAAAGEYADPTGFSFTYPEGWFPVTAMEVAKGGLTQDMKTFIAKNKIDLNRLSVLLVRGRMDESNENLNVVVNNQEITVSDSTMRKMRDMLPQKFGDMGIQVDQLQGRIQQIGSNDAVVFDYHALIPVVAFPLKHRQVYLPGGGNTYIITCTAKADTFDNYAPVFDRILASFKVPAVRGFDWNPMLKNGLIWGVVGVVIGGLIGIIKKLSGKGKQRQSS